MRRAAWLMMILVLVAVPATAADTAAETDVRKAAAAYAEAYNKRDYQALAAQWTERAELVEGGARVVGRDAIVASIRGWIERHPQAALAVNVTDVERVAGPLVRVRGSLVFTKKPGAKPVVTPFESLRVLEDGAWRLAESIVAPSHSAALDDLDWLVGIWRATDAEAGTTVTATYDRALGGHVIAGGMKIVPKSGPTLESFEVIHADRETGQVRSWLFDSTGARAEGVISADRTGFNRTFVGTPAAGSGAGRAAWTQVIVPGGEGRFTLQSIERSLDGQPLPDKAPLHFKKQ